MKRTFSAWLGVLAVAGGLHPPARAEIVMYNGAAGTLPAGQGWIYATLPLFGASATQTATGGVTRLNTLPVTSDSAGYFSNVHPLRTNLDQAAGFRVRFDARVAAETHVSTNRAGFSVIVIASDLKSIEIGFWTNEIWAQSDAPLFTHAESVAYDTAAGTNRFDLELLGARYALSANGQEILAGPVRNYSSFGAPYNTPNFIFWGDDTSSAAALVDVARVSVSLTPQILSLALTAGALQLAVSNLESGVTSSVERATDLAGSNWIAVDTLSRTGVVTDWSGALDPNATSIFLRIRAP